MVIMNKKNILITIFTIIVIVVLLIIFVFNAPQKIEQQQANNKLRNEQNISLLKYASKDLYSFNGYGETIPQDNMVKFALSYMRVLDENFDPYIDEDGMAIVEKSKINTAVLEVFGKTIDYNSLTYKVDNNYIYIEANMTGGDAQIYKYKSKEYNEQEDTYKVYIDVLEVGASRYSELEPSNVTEYSQNDVIFTMVFKYKEQEGRRILLAYNVISNW